MVKLRHNILAILALGTAGCFWGTGFFLGKIALTEMSVSWMGLFRFVFASIVLLPCLLYGRPRFVGREWGWLLAAATLEVPVSFLVQFKGLSLTTVSQASLMTATLPMLLAVAAVVFAKERLHLGGWVALTASTVGAALIAFGSNESSGNISASIVGDMLVVAAMFAAIGWILISKHLMQRHSAVIVTATVFWIGTALLACLLLVRSGLPALHYSERAWGEVAAQGIFTTALTTILWNWGLRRVPASQAGIFVNFEPLVGALLGVFLLHEAFGGIALVGAVLILAGAVYFSCKPHSAS